MMPFGDTAERRAEIAAHWASVRAGLHVPEPHVFGSDDKSAIAGHKFRAGLLISEAARHARIAIELSEVNPS